MIPQTNTDLNDLALRLNREYFTRYRMIIARWATSQDFELVESRVSVDTWAMMVERQGVAYIGVHTSIMHAPAYVLTYLLLHELLHVHLPPRKTKRGWCYHHRAFQVAEGLIPNAKRAQKWLSTHA